MMQLLSGLGANGNILTYFTMILGYTFYSKLISIRRVIRVFVTTDDDDDCIYTKEMTIQNNVSNSPI